MQNEDLLGLHVIQKGVVKITCEIELVKSLNLSSFMSATAMQDDGMSGKIFSVEKHEGSYFGEWTLLDEHITSFSAVAMGDVVCSVLTKEKFDSVVGPLAKLSRDDHKYVIRFLKQFAISYDIYSSINDVWITTDFTPHFMHIL